MCQQIIKLNIINMPNQRIESQKKNNMVVLEDDHLICNFDFEASHLSNSDDPLQGYSEPKRVFLRSAATRSQVVAVDRWATAAGQWGVSISVNGKRDDIEMYFEEEEEAVRVFSIIYKWIFNKEDK